MQKLSLSILLIGIIDAHKSYYLSWIFFLYMKYDYELSYAFAKVRFVVVQQTKNLFWFKNFISAIIEDIKKSEY